MPSFKLIQNQRQLLKISPQQIQLLNFLALNKAELDQLLAKELEENPMLEEKLPEENYRHFDSYYQQSMSSNGEGFTFQSETDIWDEIKADIRFLNLPVRQENLTLLLFQSLDNKGFLPQSNEELADILSFTSGIFYTEQEIEPSREILRSLEPAGMGSSGLQDYLLHIAKVKKLSSETVSILNKGFNFLVERDFESLSLLLKIEPAALKKYLKEIASLAPYPFFGLNTDKSVTGIAIPEFKVEIIDQKPVGGLLKGKRRQVAFSPSYLSLKTSPGKKENAFLSDKKRSARWLIEAVKERDQAMSACIAAIVKLQEAYFLSGDLSDLRPMILQDLADLTGLSLSALSRLTSQKFLETPFEIIPLKSLFSEGIQKENGDFVSNRQIREFVSKLVTDENKLHPLTDKEIQAELQVNGVSLTRRTITKYREQLNIPSSKYRRAL